MTNLTILNTSIRKFGNLYSLNDLHIVSGNDPKHRPTYFIRNEQTQDLIAELKAENPTCENSHSSILMAKNGVGTYACEELALAYATWISPKFHLVVLRAFIAMHKGQAQPELPLIEAPKPDVVLSHDDAEFIAHYIVRVRTFAKEVEVFHRKLHEQLGIPRHVRNDLAARGYDIAHEFNYWLDPFVNHMLPATKPNKPHLQYCR
ncbi:hypothetical protein A1D29_07700 [Pasteurellaceae bacterium Orientalotternb1]|nr:hypothetical protein A1D29_07700 [Pasteurellaceae bacterium Orientalotternb1]